MRTVLIGQLRFVQSSVDLSAVRGAQRHTLYIWHVRHMIACMSLTRYRFNQPASIIREYARMDAMDEPIMAQQKVKAQQSKCDIFHRACQAFSIHDMCLSQRSMQLVCSRTL
jgi:hypothetical protein